MAFSGIFCRPRDCLGRGALSERFRLRLADSVESQEVTPLADQQSGGRDRPRKAQTLGFRNLDEDAVFGTSSEAVNETQACLGSQCVAGPVESRGKQATETPGL